MQMLDGETAATIAGAMVRRGGPGDHCAVDLTSCWIGDSVGFEKEAGLPQHMCHNADSSSKMCSKSTITWLAHWQCKRLHETR